MSVGERRDDPFTLPAVHALHLAALLKRWDIAAEELFAGSGLEPATLAVPTANLPVGVVVGLFERARALSGEPAIGVLLGLQMRAPAHGFLGFAAMTASTVRQALETVARFAPTRTNALGFSLHVGGARASLAIEERADFGAARDAILFAIVVGIWQAGASLTGEEIPSASADFRFPRPAYFDRFAELAPNTRFGQAANQLVFDARFLESPIMMADPVARQLAYVELERSLGGLAHDGDVVGRVRKLIVREAGGVRSLEDIAQELGLSARTLKRRLAAHGSTYSDLLEEQQREVALLLLRAPGLSIDEVAERLGYSDTSNFRRAFRRWTGVSPAAYRRGGDAG